MTTQSTYFSILCAEEDPFNTPEIVAAATSSVRRQIRDFALPFGAERQFNVCQFWGAKSPPARENQPVASDIPTLVLAGEYDPITPPSYGELAAATLSHSSFFEFPGFGHVVLGEQSAETARPRCAMQLVAPFLDDPTTPLDESCIATIPPLKFAGT